MNKPELLKEFASALPDELPEGFEYGPVQIVNHMGDHSVFTVKTRRMEPKPREPKVEIPVKAGK